MSNEIIEYGKLIGVRGERPGVGDMIAQAVLDGEDPHELDAESNMLLVPSPQSLVCDECDLDGEDTIAASELAGWTRIWFDPGAASRCYGGLCPECGKRINDAGL